MTEQKYRAVVRTADGRQMYGTLTDIQSAREEITATFTQDRIERPAPTEPCLSTAHHAGHEWGSHKDQPGTGYWCRGFDACLYGHDALTAGGHCRRCGAQVVDPRGQTAAPPSIADMAPGTTFTAPLRDGGGPERRWMVTAHGLASSDGAAGVHPKWIDPSTIRDMTPPKET